MDEIHDLHSDLDVDNVDMYCDVVNTSDEESDEDFDDPTDILLTPGKRIAIRNPEAFTKSKRRSLRSLSDSEFDQKSPSVESSVLHKSPLNSRETQTTSVKSNPPPKRRIKPENFGISETITPFDGVCSPSEIVKRKRRRLSVIIISDDENDASLINTMISPAKNQRLKPVISAKNPCKISPLPQNPDKRPCGTSDTFQNSVGILHSTSQAQTVSTDTEIDPTNSVVSQSTDNRKSETPIIQKTPSRKRRTETPKIKSCETNLPKTTPIIQKSPSRKRRTKSLKVKSSETHPPKTPTLQRGFSLMDIPMSRKKRKKAPKAKSQTSKSPKTKSQTPKPRPNNVSSMSVTLRERKGQHLDSWLGDNSMSEDKLVDELSANTLDMICSSNTSRLVSCGKTKRSKKRRRN
eukprot:183856_1